MEQPEKTVRVVFDCPKDQIPSGKEREVWLIEAVKFLLHDEENIAECDNEVF